MLFEASLVRTQWHLSRNLSVRSQELKTSWCSILRTVRITLSVDNGGFPLLAAMNWSWCSLVMTAAHDVGCWQPSTSIRIYTYAIANFIILLLVRVLPAFVECTFWVIISVPALAGSWWAHWFLSCWCVSAGGTLNDAPAGRLVSSPLALCWGGHGVMECCCGKGEQEENIQKWDILRKLYLASSENGMSISQHARLSQDEPNCVSLPVAGVADSPAIRTMSVHCWFFLYRDT